MEFTNAELENFARGTEVFMAILDEDGVFKKANNRWTYKFDYTLSNLIGTPISHLLLDNEVQEFEFALKKVIESGQVCHKIFSMIGKELKVHAFQIDLTYTNNEIYLVGFDVTNHAREHYSLQDMSRLSKTGAWYHDPIRNETFWTDEVYRIHELESGVKIDGEKALQFYTEDYRNKIEVLVEELYEKNHSYEYAGEILTAKGNKKWIRTIAKPIVQEGKIIYICGVTVDQTRLHNNQKKIEAESQTRLLALKGIKSGLFDHNILQDTVSYSPDFKQMVGLPSDKNLPEPEFRKMIHPEDREVAYGRHLNQLKAPGNHYYNHYRLVHKTGDYQYYEVYAWRKKDKDGNTIRMVGNLINVDNRVRAEQEKESVKNSLEAMVNNGFIYSMLLDREGVIVMADERAIAIIKNEYNVNPTEEQVKYIDVMPEFFKGSFIEEFKKALNGETIRKEVERPLLQGSMQWLDIMYHPVLDTDGNVSQVLTNLLDITERKQAEISIKEAANQAQALTKLKSGILSNLSHELRTPLNGMVGTTNLLLSEELTPEMKELLEMQKESENRMLKTLTDLITLSDLDAMRLNMRLKQFTLNEIAQRCFDMYLHQARLKKLELVIQKVDQENIVLVDHEMINSALGAIVNNAIKYTNEGKIEIVCEIGDQTGALHVIDTGVGIAEENIERIFENFEMANIGMNLKYEGAGIGLSIAKKFVQLMGGTISVESQKNKGSHFTITLPILPET